MRKTNSIVISLLTLACILKVLGDAMLPFPNKDHLVGSWIGCDSTGLQFYRIELNTESGWFASSFPSEPVKVYQITSWSLDGYRLKVALKAIPEKDLEPVDIVGTADNPDRIVVTVSGSDNGGWKRNAICYRETRYMSKTSKLREAIRVSRNN